MERVLGVAANGCISVSPVLDPCLKTLVLDQGHPGRFFWAVASAHLDQRAQRYSRRLYSDRATHRIRQSPGADMERFRCHLGCWRDDEGVAQNSCH